MQPTLVFAVERAHGAREIVRIEGERATVGHGAHCDVRLAIDEAAYEHLTIEVAGAEVFVAAMPETPAVTVDGAPLVRRAVSPDHAIALTRATLRITLEAAPLAAKASRAPRIRLALIAVAALGLIGFAAARSRRGGALPAPQDLPALFEAPPTGCRLRDPGQAAELADGRFALAETRRERYPFVPRDGAAAVSLYEQAAVCYRAAGQDAEATQSEGAARALRTSITTDMRARLLRLEYALRAKDNALASQDLLVIRSVSEGAAGPFDAFLDDAQRRITAR